MLHTIFAMAVLASDLPSADQVITNMIERDNERRAALDGYTSVRRYVLENSKHHKQAYMLVRMIQHKDGARDFQIVTSSGWSGARKHVFPKLLEAEAEASRPGNPEDSRVCPQNYSFSLLRVEEVDGRNMYVIGLTPKKEKKYLMRGTIWVDSEDFAIVRMEGAPAKSPSFWVKNVQISHRYEKHGPFWLAASDSSTSDARIFGPTELKIEYFDYVLSESTQEAKLR